MWHVLVIAVAAGSISAFDIPARQAYYPGLVERRALTSAVALNASVWQGVRMAAPAAAGFLIALTSTSTVFVIGAVGFGIMASLLMGVRPLRGAEPSPEGGSRAARRDSWPRDSDTFASGPSSGS